MEGPSQEDLDELLVFGYASKIYRDDERALWLDNGGHLIPLLGDSSVLIDRYDGRGALVDLKACEPLRSDAPPALSAEELKMERWCDLERYRDCQEDEEDLEDNASKENRNGDEKTVNEGPRNYAALPYSYDSPPGSVEAEEKRSKGRDYAYAPPPGLYVPPDLVPPETMKSHAVIEKTAKFIASHGTQMEIILKTKQAGNPLFNFLTLNDVLQPYYKYLVTALKTHAYRPPEGPSPYESSPHGSESDDDDEHYLHPSLAPKATSLTAETKVSRLSEYKITGPSAYSALVSKIQEMAPVVVEEEPPCFHGNSDSWNSAPEQGALETRSQPTGEALAIIEKMAQYATKNGPAFESLASTKGDTRFQFLDPYHPHHWYYVACKESYAGEAGGMVASKFVPYAQEATEEISAPAIPEPAETKIAAVPVPERPSAMPPKPPPPDHANALNRMASLPPALKDKIEALRRKTLESRAKAEEKSFTASFQESMVVHGPALPPPAIHLPAIQQLPQPQALQPNGSAITTVENRPVVEKDEEELRRAERRKRAALFLEQMKKQMAEIQATKSEDPSSNPTSDPSPETNEVEIVAEVKRDEAPRPASPHSEESGSTEVEEIGRVSPVRRFRKRVVRDSDDEESEVKRYRHKRKKGSRSDSEESESDHERRRSRSSRKKSSKKKKKKKSDRRKRSSRSKSKRRD